jgi:glycogen debranching enzyme
MAVKDVIRIQDRYYILAPSAQPDSFRLVLKHNDTFAVFDRVADIHTTGGAQLGLFHGDTRFLSRLELRVDAERPLLLSSTVTEDNALVTADLTNPDLAAAGGILLPRDSVHILRSVFLGDAACYVVLRVRNYGGQLSLPLRLRLAADFADIFEIRGTRRAARGQQLEPAVEPGRLQLSYLGRDRRMRRTVVELDPRPEETTATGASWYLSMQPGSELTVTATIRCEVDGESHPRPLPEVAWDERVRAADAEQQPWCQIWTDDANFNEWVGRSFADLRMMVTATPHGPYPYAGVPWFSTVFGRDGLITALQTLWVNPGLAAGVLRYLAETQAHDEEPARDAEPGKILHELRGGEMAALGEVPFARYYGTIDATPLFLMLAGAYHRHTGDDALIDAIWRNLEHALAWIELYGDSDGDGLVEYQRHDTRGLINQGWKDSHDSVFHADGTLAGGPIALCEVQAYVHEAYRSAAMLAEAMGRRGRATELRERADFVRDRFERQFWSDAIGTYVLALDGDKQPCTVRTSNAGHALFTGTARPERAAAVAAQLLADDGFSGWGVRTVSAREARYNPMSYHNGSIWPHDNAMIAAGLARYGMKAEAMRIMTALFDASQYVDLERLPELFCGFHRRRAEGPTLYPVACAPQSWAAGAVFMLLQACLGLSIDARARRLTLYRPQLPRELHRLRIQRLHIGDGELDLELQRHGDEVGVNVITRPEGVEVTVVK